jgi:hypothetical protein
MTLRIDPASLSRGQIDQLFSAHELALKRKRRRPYAASSDRPYKRAFVDFVKERPWHWFITIPIGRCDDDDSMLRRLRTIEATLCGRYLTKKYHKLPDTARFCLLVAFEGERLNGTRHAHILAYLPKPTKRKISHEMLMGMFPQEFRFLWHKLEPPMKQWHPPHDEICDDHQKESEIEWQFGKPAIKFKRPSTKDIIYTVKNVRLAEVDWSRFEVVRPPHSEPFINKNLNVIRNRNRQRRRQLGLS